MTWVKVCQGHNFLSNILFHRFVDASKRVLPLALIPQHFESVCSDDFQKSQQRQYPAQSPPQLQPYYLLHDCSQVSETGPSNPCIPEFYSASTICLVSLLSSADRVPLLVKIVGSHHVHQ